MNINLTLFAQAATFAIFIWFTAKFVWPHLALRSRRGRSTSPKAWRRRSAASRTSSRPRCETADMLRDARQQAQEILAQAEKRAAQIIEEAKVAAGEEGARLIAGAKAEIEQEVSRAREMLRTQVAALAVAGAEQILRREVDAKAHADLLASVQSQL